MSISEVSLNKKIVNYYKNQIKDQEDNTDYKSRAHYKYQKSYKQKIIYSNTKIKVEEISYYHKIFWFFF